MILLIDRISQQNQGSFGSYSFSTSSSTMLSQLYVRDDFVDVSIIVVLQNATVRLVEVFLMVSSVALRSFLKLGEYTYF